MTKKKTMSEEVAGHGTPTWTIALPVLAMLLILVQSVLFGGDLPGWLMPIAAILLFATVFAAVSIW